ncbi:NAD(P)/FAD-dependent oxidoreductase [Spirosoma montaniterrae]|uniref:NADH dehydrogenase n=1 Tax=Spirosoma montaniterrae TaxID=1178516 RepID=A0A1P9X034_9BACT|nr:FAD-dependent oxidoreductase [Spirosoma montaniterrae]AQG80990.1 NADH dehydrogenase [Spirosoma montaniterrae]
MSHLVIIGNGIAGITTARHVRQQSPDHRITVISAESDHFFSRTALMYIYMGHLKYEHTKPYEDWFWAKNRIDLKRARVEAVETDAKQLRLDDGSFLGYDQLVIATGSKPSFFGWPGQYLTGVQGLYGLPDLDAMERNTQGISHAVVVGGGLIGVEMAEMLHSRHISVTMLVRERTYWSSVLPAEEGELIGRHLRRHGVDLQLQTELREILPDSQGRVRAIVTTDGREMPCQFVGLAIGVTPNVSLLDGAGIDVKRGVLVNEFFETNIPNVYAVGDCNEFREPVFGSDGAPRKANEQIWYTGRMHGETLAQTLCGKRTAYQPGVFFNSAKFFDIEYQTYGTVNAQLAEGEQTLYWEATNGEQCLRINYLADGQRVVGLHGFGLRLRHAVVDRWIRDKQPLSYVLARLREANFNPEFADFVVAESDNTLRLDRSRNWLARLFA